MEIQKLATDCLLLPMTQVTLVLSGLGHTRASAVEGASGMGSTASRDNPLVLLLGQTKEAKLGDFMWVLEIKLRSPCFHSQDFTPSQGLLFHPDNTLLGEQDRKDPREVSIGVGPRLIHSPHTDPPFSHL